MEKKIFVVPFTEANRFSVWVGGGEINDYYLTESQADEIVAIWQAMGYEEVVKEEITESEKANG